MIKTQKQNRRNNFINYMTLRTYLRKKNTQNNYFKNFKHLPPPQNKQTKITTHIITFVKFDLGN